MKTRPVFMLKIIAAKLLLSTQYKCLYNINAYMNIFYFSTLFYLKIYKGEAEEKASFARLRDLGPDLLRFQILSPKLLVNTHKLHVW